MRTYASAKLHGLRITDKKLEYDGSQLLPASLMRVVGIKPLEQVHVLNITNGNRWVTYAIPGAEGECALYGAAAHLGEIGHELIVIAYRTIEEDMFLKMNVAHCNRDNSIKTLKSLVPDSTGNLRVIEV